MPQVHGAWQVCAFGSCRSVERQTTMRSTGSPSPRGSCQSICCRPRRPMPSIAVNMVGVPVKLPAVATVHICGAVESGSILWDSEKIKG